MKTHTSPLLPISRRGCGCRTPGLRNRSSCSPRAGMRTRRSSEVCNQGELLCFTLTLTFFASFHGGYLMRLAYELGFANATLFCRRPVRFSSLDKIAFTKPVSIGSILRLRSTIIHSTASEKYPAIVVGPLPFS